MILNELKQRDDDELILIIRLTEKNCSLLEILYD